MSNWDNFINNVVKGEYLLVFIAVLMVIILAIIFYLVKLQVGTNAEGQMDNDIKMKPKAKKQAPKITKIDVKKEQKLKKEEIVNNRPIMVQSKFEFNEEELNNDTFQVSEDMFEKTKELKNLVNQVSEESIKLANKVNEDVKQEKHNVVSDIKNEEVLKEEKVQTKKEDAVKVLHVEKMPARQDKESQVKMEKPQVKNTPLEERVQVLNRIQNVTNKNKQVEDKRSSLIKEYEKEQEESAIISYEELNKRKDDINNGVFKYSDEVIENYEEEQEKKAIISYDELLEKASSTILTYQKENIPGLRVNRVDTVDKNNPVPPKRPYYKEEEFLRALKEFRATL